MDREWLEELGGCVKHAQMSQTTSMQHIYAELKKPSSREAYEPVETNPEVVAKGLPESTVLTKDELSIILDMEEEKQRLGDFQPLYPLKETAGAYYGYMEVPRY